MSKRLNGQNCIKEEIKQKKLKLASIFSPPSTSTTTSSLQNKKISSSKKLSQLESDELFARSLAKSEGINIKSLKKAERLLDSKNDKGKGKGKDSIVKKEQELQVDSDNSNDSDCMIIEATPVASSSRLPSTSMSKKVVANLEKKPVLPPTGSPTQVSTSTGSFFTSSKSPSKFTSVMNATHSKSLDTPLHFFNPKTDINTSNWPNSRVPYSFLVSAFVLISATRSRLTIVQVLTNLYRSVIELDPESLLCVIYLTEGKLGPNHSEGLELGIGSLVLRKAITETSGMSSSALSALSKKLGDPGDLAFEAKSKVRLLLPPPPLICHSLFKILLSLTKLSGAGSQTVKTSIVKKLLLSAQGEESRFLVRTLISNLRIGAVRTTIVVSLARAFCWSKPGGVNPDVRSNKMGLEFWVTEEERMIMRKEEEEAEAKKLLKSTSNIGKGKEKATSSSKSSAKGKSKLKEVELGSDEEDSEVVVESGEVESVQQRVVRAEILVRQVWARHPDYSHIVDALLSSPLSSLPTLVPLQIGTPLQPMLGSITRSLSEVYERLGTRPFVSEAKLDGQRGQIHVSLVAPLNYEGVEEVVGGGGGRWFSYDGEGGEGEQRKKIWVRLFSRHLLDQTQKYPDMFPTLAALIERSSRTEEPLTSFIIDAEIAAIDPITGALKSFAELSHRSKKDVEMGDIKIRVGVFAFDLMFLNGKSLLAEPFRVRRNLLRSLFKPLVPLDPTHAKWELVPTCEDVDPEAVQKFFQESLKMRCEGIMVKLLDHATVDSEIQTSTSSSSTTTTTVKPSRRKTLPASYEPDKRADSWLKVKKDYLDDLGDSLDLVPIGVWHGSGRKKDFWSPILLGCYDDETGTYQAVTKIISGFTDDFYKALSLRYQKGGESTSSKCFPNVDVGPVTPDLYLLPSEVWEIRCADISLSPVYPAAMGLISDERGISIRFPRFIKMRDPVDKGTEDATSASQLADMYRNQGDKGGKTDEVEEQEEKEEVEG